MSAPIDTDSPWTWMGVGMALVFALALITGIVVATWTGTPEEAGVARIPGGERVTSERPATPRPERGVPPRVVVEACNSQAAARVGPRNEPVEVPRPGPAIGGFGASAGTLYGVNEHRRDDERYRNAYAGCMRSHGYVG
jgi:hypothetical protein